jgi:hypothetical protein
MKIEYNNLYTHFVFTTLNRMPVILEKFRERIEKYITGIVNNNACKMYAIYASKPFTKRTKKQMSNKVIRLHVSVITRTCATEVVLLLKLGGNEVFLSAPGASLEMSVYASPPGSYPGWQNLDKIGKNKYNKFLKK